MKKYIGTKQIEAESMTRGDAWGKTSPQRKAVNRKF